MQAGSTAPAAGIKEDPAVPSGTAFVLDAQEARLLTEVGMLAAEAGDVARADRIFDALRALRPGRAYSYIGLALARLSAGRAAEAVRLLESAAAVDDPAERGVLEAWRGLALQIDGHAAESRRVLNAAAGMSGEGATLARRLLGLEDDAARMPSRPESVMFGK